MINRLRKGEAGFTLVELLVVVLILGILVAIAVPNFSGASTKATDGVATSNLNNVARQIQAVQASASNQATSIDANATAQAALGTGVTYVTSTNVLTAAKDARSCSATVGNDGSLGAITCS